MSRIALNDFLARRTTSLVVDVRAPIEYHQAHIPGAVDLPLLDDQQREAVGTAYARQGAEAARILGLQLVGPHLADKCKQLLKLLKSGPPPVEGSSYGKVLLYCWRGGARSSSMAWMFQGFGIDCAVLEGGYKRYRQNVRASFEQPRPVVILGGKTGSAKTLMLRELAALGEAVVDLEGLAHHKGSSFGWVNQPPSPPTRCLKIACLKRYCRLPAISASGLRTRVVTSARSICRIRSGSRCAKPRYVFGH